MRLLRLLGAFFRVGVLGEMAYRANFFIQLFQSVLDLATSLAGLWLVFSHTSTLAGWSAEEVLAVVGVYFLVGGAIRVMIQPSMQLLIESVRDGSLDFTLTKPEDGQVLVSIRAFEIWKLADVAVGVVVLAVALSRMGAHVGLPEAAAFAALLIAGGVIVYSFWVILASLSFWLVRVENILVIFQSMYEAGRWPVSIYPGWLRFALTFVVPVAFAVTVPAQALAGRLGWRGLALAAGIAAGLFIAARLLWRAGLRRYAGASS